MIYFCISIIHSNEISISQPTSKLGKECKNSRFNLKVYPSFPPFFRHSVKSLALCPIPEISKNPKNNKSYTRTTPMFNSTGRSDGIKKWSESRLKNRMEDETGLDEKTRDWSVSKNRQIFSPYDMPHMLTSLLF